MNFLFAWRYFKAKKTTNAINVISWISILAITIGTASLILVLSVFNGFEGLVKSLYSSFYPDLKIIPSSGKQLVLTAEQLQRLRAVPGIGPISLTVEEKAFLKNGESQTIVNLRGVDSLYTDVTSVDENMVNGDFIVKQEGVPLLVLGAGVESAVSVMADRNIFPLLVYLPRKGEVTLSDPYRSLSVDSVNTAGTFFIQQDFDNKYAFTDIDFMKLMLGLDENTYSTAEIGVENEERLQGIQQQLQSILGKSYTVQNRFEQNRSLYSVLQLEKWMIYAILSLILVVAAFNIIGSLTMLVLDKKGDITVLHALGADRKFIQRIFLSSGLIIGILGATLGMLLAGGIGWAQQTYHLIPLQGSTFMINYFPVRMLPEDFLLVGGTVLIIALLASFIPARKAAKQEVYIRE